MKTKFEEKMESGFALVDRIIPYTLALICVYLVIIVSLAFLVGCSAPQECWNTSKRNLHTDQKHELRLEKFRTEKVNHSVRR